jgi:hypothetical protein
MVSFDISKLRTVSLEAEFEKQEASTTTYVALRITLNTVVVVVVLVHNAVR